MEQQRSDRDLSAAEIITWAGWHEIQKRIGPCFAHLEQRQRVRRYVATSRDCSASSSARTVGNWPSTLERRTPYGMQRLLAYQSMVAQNHLYLWSA